MARVAPSTIALAFASLRYRGRRLGIERHVFGEEVDRLGEGHASGVETGVHPDPHRAQQLALQLVEMLRRRVEPVGTSFHRLGHQLLAVRVPSLPVELESSHIAEESSTAPAVNQRTLEISAACWFMYL